MDSYSDPGSDAVLRDLEFAFELAAIADSITTDSFRTTGVATETKPDMSVVTEVDRTVEMAISQHVRHHRPRDRVIGEEYGGDGAGGRRWIIDPIDGTAYFARVHPGWATFVTLEIDDAIELAVGSFPTSRKRIWAMRGAGAFDSGIPIRVSIIEQLADARVLTCEIGREGRRSLVERIRRMGAREIVCYNGALATLDVARGMADALIDIGGGPRRHPRSAPGSDRADSKNTGSRSERIQSPAAMNVIRPIAAEDVPLLVR